MIVLRAIENPVFSGKSHSAVVRTIEFGVGGEKYPYPQILLYKLQ